ncbi:MAG: CPBP family intramembrane glutamic endopeptidase [Bacteroidia bacterium]
MEPLVKHRLPVKGQLFIALGYFLFLFALSTLGGDSDMSGILNDPHMVNMMKMVQLISVLLIFILPVIGFTLLLRSDRSAFLNMGTRPPLIPFLTAVTICIVAVPAVAGMSEWNAGLKLPSSFAGLENWMRMKEKSATALTEAFFRDRSAMGLVINLFVVAFMAALSEELFFRGLLQRLFAECKMNIHVAIWLSAFLFSAFHMQFYGFLPRMFLGAVLGYLYAFSGNLWVPIIAHFVNNAFQVVLIHLMDQPVDSIVPGETEHVGLPLALLSIAMVAGQLVFLRRYYKRSLGA